MSPSHPESGRAFARPCVPLASLLLLAVLVPAGCKKAAPELVGGPAAATPSPVAAAPTQREEGREKGAAPAAEDTTAPPGVSLEPLDDFERKVFFRIVNREASVCGKAHSLIHSVKHDPDCRKAHYAIRYVARLVDAGLTDSEIEEALRDRYREPTVVRIDTAGAPSKGNANAPVTIVEYVDYECPHCQRVQPVLQQILQELGPDVRVVHKHFPLGQHTNARMAAVAAVAAHKQGKFWPYNEKLWQNVDALSKAMLEKLAGEVGLDMARFRADLENPATEAAVQADKAEGTRHGIQSTPSIFINGKMFTDARDVENLRDWIGEELGR